MPKHTAKRRTRGGFWLFSSEKPKEELTSVVPSTSTAEPIKTEEPPKSSWFGYFFGKPVKSEGVNPVKSEGQASAGNVSASGSASNVDGAQQTGVVVSAETAKTGGGRRRKTVKRKRHQNKSKGKNKKR